MPDRQANKQILSRKSAFSELGTMSPFGVVVRKGYLGEPRALVAKRNEKRIKCISFYVACRLKAQQTKTGTMLCVHSQKNFSFCCTYCEEKMQCFNI